MDSKDMTALDEQINAIYNEDTSKAHTSGRAIVE